MATFTIIRIAPSGFGDLTPYAVGIVKLDEGISIMAQVVDCDPKKVLPGMEVGLEFRLLKREGHSGILCYGHKGVPIVAPEVSG